MSVTLAELRALWPREAGSENLSMRMLVNRLADPLFLSEPDYQRGRAWSDEQCSRFVGFLCEGGVVPPLFVQRWDWAKGPARPDELLDGLQRATAIRRFCAGEVPMELADSRIVYLSDMTENDQRQLLGPSGPTVVLRYVQCSTRAEVLRFYLRLNRGGTPHTDAEIQRVRDLLSAESV